MGLREEDEKYMRMALEEAVKGCGFTNPNPMVGAVIVRDGKVLAKGYHHKCGQGHAEVEAFRALGDTDPEGATIYVTLEPCSHYGRTGPCADLIVSKKVARCVVAALDPNPLVAGRGIEKIKSAGIEVETGILAQESIRLNEIFMHYIVEKDPFVLYKSAMSLDGKICTSSGESQWISGEESRKHVHEIRNQYMGIMVGVDTVIADDPMLNCRLEGGCDPVRIVVDSHLRIPEDCRIVSTAADIPTIVACAKAADEDKKQRLTDKNIDILEVPEADGHLDIRMLVKLLGQKGIDSILLEGGGTLAFEAFKADIIDKVQFYIAPEIIGGRDAKTPVEGKGIEKLSEAFKVKNWTYEASGQDLVITGYIEHQEA